MAYAKLGLLACQGKIQKRLVVELMSLLEVLQKGLPDGTHHCMAAQSLSKGIPSTHYRSMVCSSVDPKYCGWNACSGIKSSLLYLYFRKCQDMKTISKPDWEKKRAFQGVSRPLIALQYPKINRIPHMLSSSSINQTRFPVQISSWAEGRKPGMRIIDLQSKSKPGRQGKIDFRCQHLPFRCSVPE